MVNESGSGKEWKNFSIIGTLKSGDKFGSDSPDPCAPGVLGSSGSGSPSVSCSGTLPPNSIKTTTADTASSYTYSATPTAACTFSCQPGFSWNGSSCNPTVTCGAANGRSYTSSGSIPTADLCADNIARTISATSSQYIWSCDV